MPIFIFRASPQIIRDQFFYWKKKLRAFSQLLGSDSTNNCTDCITCVAVLNGFHNASDIGGNYAVASGSNDGKLLIWENGELKVTKQLFGRIEELKWVPDHKFLISAHFGGGGRSHGRIYAHILGVTAWTETETCFLVHHTIFAETFQLAE